MGGGARLGGFGAIGYLFQNSSGKCYKLRIGNKVLTTNPVWFFARSGPPGFLLYFFKKPNWVMARDQKGVSWEKGRGEQAVIRQFSIPFICIIIIRLR